MRMKELHAEQQEEYDDMAEYLAWYEEQKRITEQQQRDRVSKATASTH